MIPFLNLLSVAPGVEGPNHGKTSRISSNRRAIAFARGPLRAAGPSTYPAPEIAQPKKVRDGINLEGIQRLRGYKLGF